jgi:uncharacterized protein
MSLLEQTPIVSEVDFSADGKHAGFLRLPHSTHESSGGWIPIPVTSIKNGTGPRMLLTAGTHGDEYEGQIILSELGRLIDPDDVSGQIIIIPMLNFPAAQAGLRTSPIDDGNLNRCFPGDANGPPTQIIAHYVETCLLPGSDFMIDLHSGGTSSHYTPWS